MPLSHESSILVIGAGTWGCSTSLHLARRGYKNVQVLDLHPVPSPIAAGNDVNKIMEHKELKSSNLDPISAALAACSRSALRGWKTDPVFQPYFHETGIIVSGHTPELIQHVKKAEIDPFKADFVALETAEDFRRTMPPGVLTGEFPGWKGWYSKEGAGWIHTQKAMVSAYTEAKILGVKFSTGPSGHVVALAYEDGDVIGAKTIDGVIHKAEHTILAAGAGSDHLLDFKRQLRPTAWTLCHIRMTPEEVTKYQDLPVLFNIAKGFFMEPDADKHELKICDEHPGYCNFIPNPIRPGETKSVPFPKHQIPLEAELRVRDFLQDTMPHLAKRPLVFARICWDADTPDRAFLIDRHPEHPSLLLAVGGSGRAAKDMPTIGGFICDALEGNLEKEWKDVMRWRPETAVHRDWHSTQDRFGGPNKVMDFQDVKDDEWTEISA
ncbi:fructosyl amine:oxygen oxidoreductase [Penicillium taxi]|uniref:fructosyl amine:oxygen oxidoreductase n=1 Tax=Penicillium taxi TaxID=168475 RepID=UPI002544D674|nr:fructosyl amine:oxygen oxidoreductase [Penicillium taxi]KAJ5885189.1 fructosyl amine:oxygen oxidoreductase [Penicillium taxi]